MLDPKSAPVARQIVVGLLCALAVSIVEILLAALGDHPQRVTPFEFVTACLAIVAFHAPLGLLLGLLTGPLVAALGQVRWLRPYALLRLGPRDLFRPRPAAFAKLTAGALALAAFFGALTYTSHAFATRFRAPWLAACANASVAVVLLAGAVLLYALLSLPLKAIARGLLGPAASLGTFVLLLAAGAGVGVWAFTRRFPQFFFSYRPTQIFWVPGLLLLLATLSFVAFRMERRDPSRVRRARQLAGVCTAVAVLGLAWVGLTYGHDNRVRHVVEDRTVGGSTIVRGFIAMTDRDGDGFSFAFGGADCDDSNPDVYPGAPDPEGDGVDSDCFHGDGGPSVAELGDGHLTEVPEAVPERPNFLFISVDALRPDHLGFNGYERPTSPNIDAFAETAVRFDNAYAQSTRSIRSMSSMMTGLYPSEIRYGREIEWTSLDPSNTTLAERLESRRYQTAVSIGSTYFERSHGFFQGFGEVLQREDISRSGAAQNGLRQLERLRVAERPWLLWIHLMNVHSPYLPHGRTSRFGQELMDNYDEEIVLADEQVGDILEALEEHDLADNTVVVLFSDHGEAFGEHGVFGHTTTLYEEELRAMLMVRVPGIEPRSVSERVGLIDTYATVINLARLETTRPVASRSLVPLMLGQTSEAHTDRELIAEILPDGRFPYDRKALLRGRYKLHWWVREGRYQLFDIQEDPSERHDLSASHPEEAEELLGLLRSWTSNRSLPEHQWRNALRNDVLEYPPDRIEHAFNLGFQGAFTLLGCDVDESEMEPGGTLHVICYWRVDEGTTRDFQFMVEAQVPATHPRLHHMRTEHYPVGGRYMTSDWNQGEIVRDEVALALPDELRRGTEVTVRLQLRYGTLLQPFEDGRTALVLERVTVPGTETRPLPLHPTLTGGDAGVDAAVPAGEAPDEEAEQGEPGEPAPTPTLPGLLVPPTRTPGVAPQEGT